MNKIFVKSSSDDMISKSNDTIPLPSMPDYSPRELFGRTFLDMSQEDDTRLYLRIVHAAISGHLSDLDKDHKKVCFLASATEEDVLMLLLTYHDVIQYLQQHELDADDLENKYYLKFNQITVHQGLLNAHDAIYNRGR
jgi:hypothetical protein